MPRYEIHEEGTAVSIKLTNVEGKQERLLEAFGECQTGQCSCPTDQYEKVAGMQLHSDEQQVTIQLEPVTGERFDTDAIGACLDYTIAETEKLSEAS